MYEVICNFVKSALHYWQIKRNIYIYILRAEFLYLNRVRVIQLGWTHKGRKKEIKKDRETDRKKERKRNFNFFNISHPTQKSFELHFTHNASVCKLKFLNDGNKCCH
jgi:hypothetical protein